MLFMTQPEQLTAGTHKAFLLHFLALALTLTLSLTLTFNHLANEPLQATIMLFSLMCLTYSSVTEHKYPIGCTMDYKCDVTKNLFKPGELRLYCRSLYLCTPPSSRLLSLDCVLYQS